MFLIVGLGNPENQYSNTRHNMGFDTINQIAKTYNLKVEKNNFEGLYEKAKIEGEDIILLKPQTFMNLSGKSIKKVADFYKISSENIIVIYDDMDIEKGIIKLRKKGGPGSHNGMKSIINELQTEDFPRIRIGIGKPDYIYDKINYVIGSIISKEEREILDEGIKKAAQAAIDIILKGIDNAMNKYN